MTDEPENAGPRGDDATKIKAALNRVCILFPHLSGLAVHVEIRFSPEVECAGISAAGLLILNELFYCRLSPPDLAIILAHELLHLLRHEYGRTEDAPDAKLINIADDFIINDIVIHALSEENPNFNWEKTVLKNALIWERFHLSLARYGVSRTRPARDYSLEEIVVLLRKIQSSDRRSWAEIARAGESCSGVISEKQTRRLFPGEDPGTFNRRRETFRTLASKAVAAGATLETVASIFTPDAGKGKGSFADHSDSMYFGMLEGLYRTPWEAALQRWFDAVAPGERSWARPSRRGAFRTDVVLPGRKREGRILHLALDTSGSMRELLPGALGAIATFCAANNVEAIHIVQSDPEAQADEYVTPDRLADYQVHGLGGTDFELSFPHLAKDPEIEYVVALTDGCIGDIPEPPFQVLWAILNSDYYAEEFRKKVAYGTVVKIDP